MPGLSTGAPCGLWISVPAADYVFYDPDTSRLHAEHIILHELAHMLSGHSNALAPRGPGASELAGGSTAGSGPDEGRSGRAARDTGDLGPADRNSTGNLGPADRNSTGSLGPAARSSAAGSGLDGAIRNGTYGSELGVPAQNDADGDGLGWTGPEGGGLSLSAAALARLVPDLDPRTVRTVLGRVSYTTSQEREAEMLASLIRARAAEPVAPVDLPGRTLSRVADVLKFRP